MGCTKYKDPQDVLDYGFDFANELASGETISASTWTVETGITKDSDSYTTTTTTIWLSGGTAGTTYTLVNHVTTSASREYDKTMLIVVYGR